MQNKFMQKQFDSNHKANFIFFSASPSVLNINSVIKFSTIIFGAIGLIFTAYRIFNEGTNKKTIPAPVNAAAPDTMQDANLQTQALPSLQEKKY